jgi:hypothetical protein
MALDPQLVAFMPDTVTIAPFASFNNYGERTTGSTRTAAAYVQPDVTLTDTGQIEEKTHPVRAFINDVTITVKDKITLPDSSVPEIATIAVHTSVSGLDHTVVTFR